MGLVKGTWLNKNDNLGSVPYHIKNETTLNKALGFSSKAFKIASDWPI